MNNMKRIKLNEYIKNIETHDVTLINGLKGSGKYQLMMQLINTLENTYKKKTLYLNCEETCNFKTIDDVLKYLDEINKNTDDEKSILFFLFNH